MTTGNSASTSGSNLERSQRSVFKIIGPAISNMGKMSLKKIINGGDSYQNYTSPFFIFDEFGPMELAKGAPFRVDAHPHAGIIPTTYLFEGNAHHRDSMGNDFQYEAGDFIQFTSGRGALHMEETGDGLFENGGTFHGIQSWLNIPSGLKNSEPNAAHFRKEDIEIISDDKAMIRVILGEVFGVRSQTRLLMPVNYWHVTIKEGATVELPIDPQHNAFIYLLKGQLVVGNGQTVREGHAVLYERDGSVLRIHAKTTSDLLVLGGEVNNESYVAAGPFVLNNEKEVRQAYADFKAGKYGDIDQTNGKRRL